MVKEKLNFELFNYLNEVQEELSMALLSSQDYEKSEDDDAIYNLAPKEQVLYRRLVGVLEYYIKKLDTLFLEDTKELEEKTLGVITIRDSSIDEYAYEVEFEGFGEGAVIPCYNKEGMTIAVSKLKKEFEKNYAIKVYNDTKGIKVEEVKI